MRFSLKVFFATLTITALSLGLSGSYLITALFNSALNREINQAMDENNLLRFAFETAALSLPSRYDRLPDITVEQIGGALEIEDSNSGRFIRILSENSAPVYTSPEYAIESAESATLPDGIKTYRIIKSGAGFFVQTSAVMKAMDRRLVLDTFKDVTSVFRDRSNNYSLFRNISLIILVFEAIVIYVISLWLTRPIYQLSQATKIMADGDYTHRAVKITSDELGMLTDDFNKMAEALENHIAKLQHEAVAKEDFVAAVAHELKTPLTSIIGYSDLLRSYKVNDDQLFQSADYIFNEGKRLESMSLKLLDLIVLRRHEIQLTYVKATEIFDYLREIYAGRTGFIFTADYEEATLIAEVYLIKTVLVNLIDNAIKAIKTHGHINITGFVDESVIDTPGQRNYRFTVMDDGVGIAKEELSRITEAFYMVDKSRTKSREGAGIGLALCAEILQLHESKIEFASQPGTGTTVSFTIKCLLNDTAGPIGLNKNEPEGFHEK